MSSTENQEESLSSMNTSSGHRSLTTVQQLDLASSDSTGNDQSPNIPQCMTSTLEINDQFQLLQIDCDIKASLSSDTVPTEESTAEEGLIERFKEITYQFMTRPNRQYSYDVLMRWKVDHGNEIHYHVALKVHPRTDVIS